jgi:SNF2 family DNA or RNA helicase
VERTIFCKLTELQIAMYQQLCTELKPMEARTRQEKQDLIDRGVTAPTGQTLPLITLLKKLCNTPDLLRAVKKKDGSAPLPPSVSALFPKSFKPNYCHPEHAGKLAFLDHLLQSICKRTPDRIVIVSNYTQTLDVLATLCKRRGIYYFQLDGSTVVAKRQQLVDLFNVPTAKERMCISSLVCRQILQTD